jgi:hypothetical protein
MIMNITKQRGDLFAELRRVTAMWNGYDDIPKSQQGLCRAIGLRLHALGGEDLMREAYYDAKAANPDVHVIQAYWDGIGDWRW